MSKIWHSLVAGREKALELFDAIEKRRSIRRYTSEIVPDEVVLRALEAAVLAPNSSNAQTWNFYWVKSPEKKAELVRACLSQSAARTAQHLIVLTADPRLWRRSQPELAKYVNRIQAPRGVILYYERFLPFMYATGWFDIFSPFKGLFANIVGIFRPIVRGPFTRREMFEVAVKSAALAAENFVLAITAQGYASCMMEGFDEWRVRRLLRLRWRERVVMVISVGREAERGTWGPRFRIETSQVVHEV